MAIQAFFDVPPGRILMVKKDRLSAHFRYFSSADLVEIGSQAIFVLPWAYVEEVSSENELVNVVLQILWKLEEMWRGVLLSSENGQKI